MSEGQDLPVPPELERLSTFIDSHVECLAGSNSELRSIALCATNHIFDWALQTEKHSKPHLGILLATLTEYTPPQTRSRKRNDPAQTSRTRNKIDVRETPLQSLLIEGMNTGQIWQQLDLRTARICDNLRVLQGDDEVEGTDLEEEDSDADDSEAEDEDEDAEMDIDEDLREGLSGEEEDENSTAEDVVGLRGEDSEDEEDNGLPASMLDVIRGQQKPKLSKSCSQGFRDLDDGFFDLVSFNAETSKAEARGMSGRDFVSDGDSTEESDIDLFGSMDDDNDLGLFYNDFFDPPHQSIKSSKVRFHERVSVKKIRAVGKGMPVSSIEDEDSDEDEDNDIDYFTSRDK